MYRQAVVAADPASLQPAKERTKIGFFKLGRLSKLSVSVAMLLSLAQTASFLLPIFSLRRSVDYESVLRPTTGDWSLVGRA